MIGEECVHEFFQGVESRGQGQGLDSQGQDQGLQNCPRGRGLVLEHSNTDEKKSYLITFQMHQIYFGWDSAPYPAVWIYGAPPDPMTSYSYGYDKGMKGRDRVLER